MTKRVRYTRNLALVIRILVAFSFLLPVYIGCSPGVESPAPLPVQSLLLISPMLGDEPDIRSNPPSPERLIINETSVEGWMLPPGSQLRFPVDLDESAWLSFALGATSSNSLALTETGIRISFIPFDISENGDKQYGEETILLETSPVESPEIFDEWMPYKMDLSSIVPSEGEIIFSTPGEASSNPGIYVMMGEPVLYYPDRMRHKNILLIGIDTLRRDALGVYGGRPEISPNISRIADHGTVFNRSWSQAPFTGPSFASMLTGLYPADITSTITTVQVPDRATTVAEILLSEGYSTRMVCGNPYLGSSRSGFQQGIETQWYRSNTSPSESVEIAKKYIETCSDRDWFLFLHIMDPHSPYDPPRELVDTLCTRPYRGRYEDYFLDMAEWELYHSPPLREDVDRVHELYEAEVADVDNAIGEIYSYLEQHGMLDDTLIILTADHGEEFFEHNQWGHGQSLLQEIVNMPLIIWGGGLPEDIDTDTCVGNMDLAPTILDYAGAEIPGGMCGTSLLRLGSDNPGRIIFGEGNLRRGHHRKFAVDWPYKCILDFFTGETRLYDLANDPGETLDISGQNLETAQVTQRLSTEMVTTMVPMQTTLFVAIIGNPDDGPARFSGTITVPGGIGFVTSTGKIEDDEFTWSGNTVEFDFSNGIMGPDPKKALIIYPSPDSDIIEIEVLADGRLDPTRFFPYASNQPEPSGSAVIDIYDLPWPNRIPPDARERPVAIYILGIPGFPRDDTAIDYGHMELDPETREQLRALGYLNQVF